MVLELVLYLVHNFTKVSSTEPGGCLISLTSDRGVSQGKVSLGRVVGPLSPLLQTSCHISRFGVIPKGHQPNKWHLIVDLSFPKGRSINDGIP